MHTTLMNLLALALMHFAEGMGTQHAVQQLPIMELTFISEL